MSELYAVLLVRCVDRTVFKVRAETLEPVSYGVYDAYCFSDPVRGAVYMDHAEWCLRRSAMSEAAQR